MNFGESSVSELEKMSRVLPLVGLGSFLEGCPASHDVKKLRALQSNDNSLWFDQYLVWFSFNTIF